VVIHELNKLDIFCAVIVRKSGNFASNWIQQSQLLL